jgi:hypothetical protein
MRTFSFIAAVGMGALIALMPLSAWAATLYFKQVPGTGRVSVYLDTSERVINTLEGTVDVTSGMVTNVGFGGSVVPLWLEQPQRDHLSFSGVIPGGYEGKEGKLFDLEFKGGTNTNLSISNAKAYINDGEGTAADLVVTPLQVHVTEGITTLANKDMQAPVFSEVQIARDAALFGGDWFAAFNAHDEQSGISGYEIAERAGDSTEDIDKLRWRAASSPVRLEDQVRQSTVFIRARDGAGNVAVTSSRPLAATMIDPRAVLGGIALILLALALIIVIRKIRMRP